MVNSGETPLTEAGRERTLRLIAESEQTMALQRSALAEMGLSPTDVERALQPMESFVALLRKDAGISPLE